MNSRHHVFPGRRRSKAQHDEAMHLARKAVACDPLDCRTQLCLAWAYAMNSKFPQAEMSYRLAYNLNENDPWALVSCALGLAYCGAIDEAVRLEDDLQSMGLDLSPLHWAYAAGVRFIRGDFGGCVEATNLAADSTFYISGWKAAALAQTGRLSEARIEGERFVQNIAANWVGDCEPTRVEIANWFLDAFPIRSTEVMSALQEGLALAGLDANA